MPGGNGCNPHGKLHLRCGAAGRGQGCSCSCSLLQHIVSPAEFHLVPPLVPLQVEWLSGGEKARLALAKFMLTQVRACCLAARLLIWQLPGLLHLTLQRCQLLAAGARHRLGRLPPLCIFHLCRARCWCWMSPPTTWTSPPKRRWRRLCAPLRVRLLAPHQLLLPFNDVCLLCVVVLLLLLQPVCVCKLCATLPLVAPTSHPVFRCPRFVAPFQAA